MLFHNKKINVKILKASKKFMFQKIKFLQSNNNFKMEAQDQTEKKN